jgi:hypothetical protein
VLGLLQWWGSNMEGLLGGHYLRAPRDRARTCWSVVDGMARVIGWQETRRHGRRVVSIGSEREPVAGGTGLAAPIPDALHHPAVERSVHGV